MVATFEAFIGLLTFSIATGLFYGRFSRPRAYLQFSENALIAPYKDGTALMFRLAPYKNNALTDAHVILSVAIELEENGERRTRFFNLTTELSHIDSLSLNWTVVHHITDTSPFYRFTQDDFIHTDMEIIVQVRAFDDVFSDTVVQRTSYINSEIIYGAKFLPMYFPNRTDKTTVLDLAQLNTFEKVELPNVAS